jgi:aminopeptidase N
MDFIGQSNMKIHLLQRKKIIKKKIKFHQNLFLFSTHFEPTGARRAFPCFDEPALKAVFKVTLVVPKNKTYLANMQVEKEEEHPYSTNKKVVIYKETPLMSTYLLAFVVGDFDSISSETQKKVKVSVYAPPNKTNLAEFALNVATKTLDYFSNYFNIDYPLPKCDLIAISEFPIGKFLLLPFFFFFIFLLCFFFLGAMENWGLVTFRESALLLDEKTATVPQKQRVAYVVAHELAHMWFGNLVTMEWWTDLWFKIIF